jgi:hypothetical protein
MRGHDLVHTLRGGLTPTRSHSMVTLGFGCGGVGSGEGEAERHEGIRAGGTNGPGEQSRPLDGADRGRENGGRGCVGRGKRKENRVNQEGKRKGERGWADRGFRPDGILGF